MADGVEPKQTEDQDENTIKITVKTATAKNLIEISGNSTVKDLREQIQKQYYTDNTVAQLCLIFAGQILKDQDALASKGIKDGITIHLVVKSQNKAQDQAAQHSSNPAPQTTPSAATSQPASTSVGGGLNLGGLGGLPDLAGLGGLGDIAGLGAGNDQLMGQMRQQMMDNPDMLRQALENPLVQQIMQDPATMQNILSSNPQMQDIIQRNPEIGHLMNNPEMMRQTMEMIQNPAMMQEMMRNQDRAMSNLESIPGGFNALRRLYTDIQEPMMNAADEQMRTQLGTTSTTTGTTPTTTATPENPQRGTENVNPLPNPWGGGVGSRPTTVTAASSTPNPFSLFSSLSNPRPGTTGSAATAGSTNPAIANLMSSAQQANPDMHANMSQSPFMQQMMQQLMSNPQTMTSLLQNNPMFANNPQLASQMAEQLPTMMERFSDPSVMRSMQNPRVLQALQQIQQGMQTLQQEAPELMPMFGLGSGAPSGSTNPTATTQPNPTSAAPPPPGAAASANQNFGHMLSSMMSSMGSPTSSTPAMPLSAETPDVRFATQLTQLNTMGFQDRAANIQALTASGGDVNAAIERLIGGA